MFRVIVQDSRRSPTSGKVVAHLGSYDPHAKTAVLNKEKATFYLEHGAQPSDRAVRLLKSEGVKLPGWVKLPPKKERTVRNAEKRRSTAPEKPAEEAASEETATEKTPVEATPADEAAETPATEETPAEKASTGEAEAEKSEIDTESETTDDSKPEND